ncbi:MAG: DUF481 domain-containing protein [Gammaproteobacteria bacterium]|nr:MAG: DUF481 domain-containing protein [Gammaproteobacteria bacterium]
MPRIDRAPAAHSLRQGTRLLALIALLSVVISPVTAMADTDVVTFRNGDRLTGKVKSLERGRLRFKTDATGTIDIEWDEVASLSSNQNIQAETDSGARYFGHIAAAETEGTIVVETSRGPAVLDRDRIVKMTPIDQQGLRDIDLSVSAGYNFANANSVQQFNVGAKASYVTQTRILSATFSSLVSDSKDNDVSQRQALGFSFSRLRSNRWLTNGNLSFDRNDELGINLRTSLGGGGGRILTQSNHSLFILQGGMKVTRENLIGEPEDKDSLESYAQMTWEWYRYDTPELDWSTNLEIIPSVTEWGRVRAEFDAKLKWEIIGDLYWQLEYYNSYDSEPQSAGASNNDYGIITSVAYDF